MSAGHIDSRGRLLRACAAAALLGLGGCGPGADRPPADTLVIGQSAEPRALDPHTVTSLEDFRILANIYEGLVRYRAGSLEIEPALAREWSVSEDGRVYTFRLREDVRFHDGSAFDAEAVRFNFERMLDEDHPWHHTGPFPLAFFFDRIADIRTPGPYTVELVLDAPYAPMLSNLAYPTGFMVSPAAVRAYREAFGRHPSGTGPFRFVEWRSQRRVVLARNEAYHGVQARMRRIIFRPLADPVTRLTELLTGGVDLVVQVPADSLAALRDDARFTVHERTGPHLWYLVLDLREGPFADRRVRLAANHAVDRRALVEDLLQGTAQIATGPVPAAFAWAHDADLEPYAYDPERARALLAEAGHAGGVDVDFYVPQGGSGMLAPVQMATAIQADLAAVGIRAKIETYEWNAYLAKVNAGLEGPADMAEMAWMTNDPDTLLSLALHSEAWPERGGFNSGYYADPRVDRLIEAARTTTDRTRRAELYRELQRRVHADAPWVVIASWRQNTVTHAAVRGLRLQPSFLLPLAPVYKR